MKHRITHTVPPILILTSYTEKEVRKWFAHYDFGDEKPTIESMIELLANSLLTITAGMRVGGTLTHIMRDMGLLCRRSLKPTKKGREFMFDCYNLTKSLYHLAAEQP